MLSHDKYLHFKLNFTLNFLAYHNPFVASQTCRLNGSTFDLIIIIFYLFTKIRCYFIKRYFLNFRVVFIYFILNSIISMIVILMFQKCLFCFNDTTYLNLKFN